MSQYLLSDYLPGLATTIAVEFGVVAPVGFWSLRAFGVVVLVNLLTHPALHVLLWLGYWWHAATPPVFVLLALEVAVALAEGFLSWRWLRLPAGKALLLSAAMNTVSGLLSLLF